MSPIGGVSAQGGQAGAQYGYGTAAQGQQQPQQLGNQVRSTDRAHFHPRPPRGAHSRSPETLSASYRPRHVSRQRIRCIV